ncbi:glycoside hydrolase family 25 protein [Flavobacterium agricola]|uniref:Glycoside hydrolase family 25 protein n=1 Tax=Flavobacterium agricola TaxID=2870839 RepID=A0ABY6LWC2_9FLAO|nr:GH25 family lysozyme [Flavobacterium agricola]UYW00494.1 glycoside hydrolase family 25 protein [Flavobacterium agricola]
MKNKKPKPKNTKKELGTSQAFFYFAFVFVGLVLAVFVLHYRHGIQLYLCLNHKTFCESITTNSGIRFDPDGACKAIEPRKISAYNIRNLELLNRHEGDYIFGIDVSQYQDKITWDLVSCIEDVEPISFVIVRATAGANKKDAAFKTNWQMAKEHNFIRGAYHYYRPDEDPKLQAANFIKTVTLQQHDFPPILDVEALPKKITRAQFIQNIKTWMDLVEKHYKQKTILYSGQNFHESYLESHFPNHVLWIANYNFFTENMKPNWHFWQFTEKGYVNGIKGAVDVNVFNGNQQRLDSLLIK